MKIPDPPIPRLNGIIANWGWLPVLVLGIALYSPSLTFSSFHYDDEDVVLENPAVHTLSHSGRFFLEPSIFTAYRPLVTWSFALNYAWSGADGRGFRAFNLAVHVATALLTIGLCRALGLPVLIGWLAGVAMVIHPVHVQIVDYISSRSSGVSAALVVAAVWAYSAFRRGGAKWLYALAMILGASAILAKESAVVLPVLLAAVEWVGPWRTRPTSSGRWWLFIAPFAALSVAYVWPRLGAGVVGTGLQDVAVERADGFTGILTGLRIVAAHTWLWVYPFSLSIDHPMPLADRVWTEPMLVALGVVAAGVGLLLYGVRSRSPILTLAPIWFVVSLLPSLVLPFVTTRALLFEHRAYGADVGLAMLTAMGGLCLYKRARGVMRYVVVAAGIFVAVTWGVLTITYAATWKTHTSAWANAARLAPESLVSQYNWGMTLFHEGREDEALAAFLRARELNPTYKDVVRYVDAIRGKHDDWIRVIAVNQEIVQQNPRSEAAHFNLGVAFQKLGALAEAESSYRAAIALWPNRAESHSNLGVIYLEEDRIDAAIDHFQQALRVNPSSFDARYNLATAYTRAGEPEKARGQYLELLRLMPATAASDDYRSAVKQQFDALDRTGRSGS